MIVCDRSNFAFMGFSECCAIICSDIITLLLSRANDTVLPFVYHPFAYTWHHGTMTHFSCICHLAIKLCCTVCLRSGVVRTQKLKTHLLRTQSSKVLAFKPGAGQYIAMHATPTARDFFLANVYPSGPFTCIFFPKSLPSFFCVSCG